MTPTPPLLDIRGLSIRLPAGADRALAVKEASLSVAAGETLCIVGESGSGKSMIANAVMGQLPQPLVAPVAGAIAFQGQDLLALREPQWRALRGNRIGMIFQDPMSALNPVMRIGEQLEEALDAHLDLTPGDKRARILAALRDVRLPDPEGIAASYPGRLSGGQRQRVMIACALMLEPALLIADEPTTALDVTTQAQILELIRDLQARQGTAVLFITHDFGVVSPDRRPRRRHAAGRDRRGRRRRRSPRQPATRLHPQAHLRDSARHAGGWLGRQRAAAAAGRARPAQDLLVRRRTVPARTRNRGHARHQLHPSARRSAGPGGRIRLRKIHAGPLHRGPAGAGRRPDSLQRPGARRATGAGPRADGLPGPAGFAQPAPYRGPFDHGRPAGARPGARPRPRARGGTAAFGGPEPGRRRPLSARILRRTAPAHRHRPRAGGGARLHRGRRTGFGAGRIGAGAGAGTVRQRAQAIPPEHAVRDPRSARGGADVRPHRRHAAGPHHRMRLRRTKSSAPPARTTRERWCKRCPTSPASFPDERGSRASRDWRPRHERAPSTRSGRGRAALHRPAEQGAGHALSGAGLPGPAARHRMAHRGRPGRPGGNRRRGVLAAAGRRAGQAAQPAPDPIDRRRRGSHLRRSRGPAPRAGVPRVRGRHDRGHEHLRRLGGDQSSPALSRLRAQLRRGHLARKPHRGAFGASRRHRRAGPAGPGGGARYPRWATAYRAGAARPSPICPRTLPGITAPTVCRPCWPRPTPWSVCCR